MAVLLDFSGLRVVKISFDGVQIFHGRPLHFSRIPNAAARHSVAFRAVQERRARWGVTVEGGQRGHNEQRSRSSEFITT